MGVLEVEFIDAVNAEMRAGIKGPDPMLRYIHQIVRDDDGLRGLGQHADGELLMASIRFQMSSRICGSSVWFQSFASSISRFAGCISGGDPACPTVW